MYIKSHSKTKGAWTLMELVMALGVFSLLCMALVGTYGFSIKTMASLYNYCLLDQYNRQAMDRLTQEIRQAKAVLAYTTNSITVQTAGDDGSDGPIVTYWFSPSTKRLVRKTEDGSSKLLLNDCSLLSFQMFTRCPSNGVFGSFPVAINNWSNTVKVLQLTWKTAVTLPSGIVNSENIQTARVVIRKQQQS